MDKQGGMDLLPKNKKKFEKKTLPIDVGVAIYPTSITTQMMGAWLVVGKENYNEEGQMYPFFVTN